MGYASFLEDINRRLDEGLADARARRSLSADAKADPLSDKKLLRDLEGLIATASRELSRLEKLIAVSSDRDINLAQEVVTLRSDNERLRRIIASFEGSSTGLADRYLQLVDEKNELEELINRDLVDEFYDLDNRYELLKERENSLLRQETRLIEKIKVLKDERLAFEDEYGKRLSETEEKLRNETNLREILEVAVGKHRNKQVAAKARKVVAPTTNSGVEFDLSTKIRELESKWK